MSGRQAFRLFRVKPVAFMTKQTHTLTLMDPQDGYSDPKRPYEGLYKGRG